MASVELIFRLFLAAMFLVAAAGKLLDLQGSRDTVVAFGLPQRLGAIGGTALPFAEIATAAALLPTASARWGAVAAVVLLATFNLGVAFALSQGRTPDCNCFGVVSSEQISNRTLLRNGVLILMAAAAVWQAPGSSLSSWTSDAGAANLIAALAVVLLSLAVVLALQARHQVSEMRFDLASVETRRVKPGLQPGEQAPDFELASLTDRNERHSLAELLKRGNPALLVFASQSCGPCMQMIPELIRWNETLSERISFVMIESGVEDATELAEYIAQHGSILTVVDTDDRSVNEAFQVNATPAGILVGADGRIAAPQTAGGGNIEGLVRAALELPTMSASPVAV
jgi:thiol-disulfide isomerase/thioredoxin